MTSTALPLVEPVAQGVDVASPGIVVEALLCAHDALAGLPLSAEVRTLQAKVLAVQTVLLGIVRDELPVLTQGQRERLAQESITLACQAMEVRHRGDGLPGGAM
jgi:hypothetical protein